MAGKSKNAFGSLANIESALQSGTIDAYDILFLDGETEPKVGWIDKNGVARIVKDKEQIIRVDELPVVDGDSNVIYIYNNECYIWDGSQCVSTTKPADFTELEADVAELETELAKKANADEVDTKIGEVRTEVETMIDAKVEEKMDATIDAKIDEKIANIEATYEIIEF